MRHVSQQLIQQVAQQKPPQQQVTPATSCRCSKEDLDVALGTAFLSKDSAEQADTRAKADRARAELEAARAEVRATRAGVA